MKKALSLVLVVLLLIMMVPVHVSLAENEADEALRDCSHSGGYYTRNLITYYDYNHNYHKKFTTTVYYCSLCDEIMDMSDPVMTYQAHSFDYPGGHYLNSVHVGHYSNHYYVYGHTCGICDATYTWHVTAACKPNACVDPS
jgi:hypothetical protein